MKDYTITSWTDYWKIYDTLIETLNSDNKTELVTELREAQRYVNGFTDGWFEFMFGFEKSVNANREKMTVEQLQIADFLLKKLNTSLTNR